MSPPSFTRNPQIGTTSPSNFTLRQWRQAALGISKTAFDALKEVCASTHEDVDASSVSLKYLTRKEFVSLKKTGPCQQAMCIHLLSR